MNSYIAIIFTFSVVLLSACGSNKIGPAGDMNHIVEDTAPTWVSRYSGAFNGEYGRAFYGVGVAPKESDANEQRDRAKRRARRQVLFLFDTYITYTMRGYASSFLGTDITKENYESHATKVRQSISINDMQLAQIKDNWRDTTDGNIYSLAILDLSMVVEILSDKKELDAKVLEYVRANADDIFDTMEKEETKHDR